MDVWMMMKTIEANTPARDASLTTALIIIMTVITCETATAATLLIPDHKYDYNVREVSVR